MTNKRLPGAWGAIPPLALALRDQGIQRTEELPRRSTEATGAAGVAGRPLRASGDEQGVGIAVDVHVVNHEVVARGFALCPQLLAGAAEKGDMTRLEGRLQCLRGHEPLHEHFATVNMLDDHRHQAGYLVPVQLLIIKLILFSHGSALLHYADRP